MLGGRRVCKSKESESRVEGFAEEAMRIPLKGWLC